MQRCALYLARVAAAVNIPFATWHVPGFALIAEGVDGALLAGESFGADANLEAVLGQAVSDSLWERIWALAYRVGWTVTVEAFASESNARVPRFWSRFPEQGAEAFNAL